MVALLVRDSWGSGGLRSEWPLGPEVGSESSACECSFRLISSKGAGRAQTPSPRPAFRCSEIGKAWTGIYSEGIQVERCGLSAARWRRLRFFLPGRAEGRGYSKGQPELRERRSISAARRCPVEEPAPGYGNWKSVHKRFVRWDRAGTREEIFQVLLDDPDNRYVMIDSTIVWSHRQAACGKGGPR